MAEKPDVKPDLKPHVPPSPPSRASEDARHARESEEAREARADKDAKDRARAAELYGGEPPLADPIQLTGAALIPPAAVDETLVPDEPAIEAEGGVLRPDEPDVKTLTGAEQGRFEVLTGKRLQRETEPPTATKREREARAHV